MRLIVCLCIFSNTSLNFWLTLLISSWGCPEITICWSKLSIWSWSRNQSNSLSFLSDVLTKKSEEIYAIMPKNIIKYMLIQMRFLWTIMWGVTFVTNNLLPTCLYIKYISSIFAIDFIRWDCSRVSPSGLSISNISVSGARFFPRIIFWLRTGLTHGGICHCCLLYQFWKNIPLASILKSKTWRTVNRVNFRLICVDVLSWEKKYFLFCMRELESIKKHC